MTETTTVEKQKQCWIDGSDCYVGESPNLTLEHCKLCQKSRNEKYKSYALGQAIIEALKHIFPSAFKKRQGDEQ